MAGRVMLQRLSTRLQKVKRVGSLLRISAALACQEDFLIRESESAHHQIWAVKFGRSAFPLLQRSRQMQKRAERREDSDTVQRKATKY